MDDVYVQLPLCQRLMSCRCAPVVLELNLKLGLLDVSATLLLTTPYVRCPPTPGSEDDIKHFILVQSVLTSPSPHPSHPAHSMCAQSVCWKSLPPGEGARALSGWARKHTHTDHYASMPGKIGNKCDNANGETNYGTVRPPASKVTTEASDCARRGTYFLI